MTWIAAAIIGGSVVSGVIGASGAKDAAKTQADAANQASATQLAMFNQTQQNAQPWINAGEGALSQLASGTQPGGALTPTAYTPFTMDQFTQDPGYQFQLQQGQNALTNASSLTGGMNSNNLKGLIGYSQGLANTDYQQALNNYMAQFQLGNQQKQQQFTNLSTLSQAGANAGQGLGTQSANVGSTVGGNTIGAGNAQAAGTVGAANAVTGALGHGYNQWLQSQFMNQGMGVPVQQYAAPVTSLDSSFTGFN